jgi:hypothetical protein
MGSVKIEEIKTLDPQRVYSNIVIGIFF